MMRYHYEFVAGRPEGHQWRVGDDMHDDFMRDFAMEKEAQSFVRLLNDEQGVSTPSSWKY